MSEEQPLDIYLAGTEHIHLISDLFDSEKKNPRNTGRTKRLACKYAELAMKCPNTKVIIVDHFDDNGGNLYCFRLVQRILDTLSVDYEIGQSKIMEKDFGSFTGVRSTGRTLFYIIVTPPKFPSF